MQIESIRFSCSGSYYLRDTQNILINLQLTQHKNSSTQKKHHEPHAICVYSEFADSTISLFVSTSIQNRRFEQNIGYKISQIVTRLF